MKDGYNGWSNRPTWNVVLWIDNTEHLYSARVAMQNLEPWSAKSVQSFAQGLWEDGFTPDGDALADANWQEIADSWNDEEF